MKQTLFVLIALVICIPAISFAANGQPVQDLQNQINQLNTNLQHIQTEINQLNTNLQNIQLTPGPVGPTGATGATGPMGPAGAAGLLDLSRVYQVGCYGPTYGAPSSGVCRCNAGDILITGGANCSAAYPAALGKWVLQTSYPNTYVNPFQETYTPAWVAWCTDLTPDSTASNLRHPELMWVVCYCMNTDPTTCPGNIVPID